MSYPFAQETNVLAMLAKSSLGLLVLLGFPGLLRGTMPCVKDLCVPAPRGYSVGWHFGKRDTYIDENCERDISNGIKN